MVGKEIIEELKKLKDIDEKKKFLIKEIKKTKDKNEKLELQRLIDELNKKEEHVPVEGQDLSLVSPLRNLEVEEAPKYERSQNRDFRRNSELERTVENTNDERRTGTVYGPSTSDNIIKYENSIDSSVQVRNSLERKWAEEGIKGNAIDLDPQIKARAREIASKYLSDTPENIERYVSGQDQRTIFGGNQNYQSARLLRDDVTLEIMEKKKKELNKDDIERYFTRVKGDSF
ncbi:hypothetical protein J4455_00525 [Candidatus Woesearchaeota archaeon]|nr:hypothetical protein [Candidatus Woesearchaeota archaeon]